jgi:hypothetical protein
MGDWGIRASDAHLVTKILNARHDRIHLPVMRE